MVSLQQHLQAQAATLACCEGVPQTVVTYWVSKVGVEDAVDLAGLYRSEEHLRTALVKHIPELTMQEIESAVTGWLLARQHAEVVDMARARQILQPLPSRPMPSLAEIPLRAPRMRNVDLDSTHKPKRFKHEVTSSQRFNVAGPREFEEPSAVRKRLLEIYEALGPLGMQWHECSDDELPTRRRLLLQSVKKFTDESITRKFAATTRWRKWARTNNLAPAQDFNPNPVQLGKFLESVAEGGATASPQLVKSLQWWQDYVGVPFPLDSPLLAGFLQTQPGHVVNHGFALPPAWFLRLVSVACAGLGCISEFAALFCHFVISGLRLKHAQLYAFERVTARWIYGRCLQGKRFEKGQRPSFMHCTPRFAQPSMDLWPIIESVWIRVFGSLQHVDCMIPDIDIPRRGALVRESTWLRKKMPHAKVGELARGLLLAAGVPAGDLKRITPKSARKSNSTGGDILFFPDSLAHGLGNWQEITKGERPRSSRAIFTMPLTYSDAPLLTSGAAKCMVLASYSQCADDLRSLQLSTDSEIQWGVVRKANFDLSALLAVFEGSDWEIAPSIIAQSSSSRGATGLTPLLRTEQISPEKTSTAAKGMSPPKPSSAQESTSSASESPNSSDSPSEESATLEDLSEWFIRPSRGRRGLVHWQHHLDVDGRSLRLQAK